MFLPMLSTRLPDTRGAAPPYPEFRPMEIGQRGNDSVLASRTIALFNTLVDSCEL